MAKKKVSIIIISVVAAVTIISAAAMSMTASARQVDMTDEAVGYYVISVNPAVEIAVGSGGNVISVAAQNDDGEDIIAGQDFSGMTAEQAIERVLDLIYDAGYLQKSGLPNIIDIGYFTDGAQVSEEDILALVPEKYRADCEVTVTVGKAPERISLALGKSKGQSVPPTYSPTGMPSATPEPSMTPEPSPSETPEETATSSKKSGSGSDDIPYDQQIKLQVSISGSNAVFTWNKIKYHDFSYAELKCVPKATSSWKEDPPSVVKKITNENTISCTVSLSSLGFTDAGQELFFYLSVLDKIPSQRDDNGNYPTLGSTRVSIYKKSDGTYTLYNDNPSVFGHGVIGVDYFAPSLSVKEANGTLCLTWTHPNTGHEDFRGVIIYASESATVPKYPDGYNCNYYGLGPDRKTYYLELSDFYNLQAGKTYFFTAYSLYFCGDRIPGNTVRATLPHKKDTAFVNVHLNTLKAHLNIYWTDAVGTNIQGYKYYIEYKEPFSNERIRILDGYKGYEAYNQSSGKFETGQSIDFIPGRTYYVSLYTIYNDGTEKFGNEVAIVIPGTPVTPEPSATPTESPSATPSATPTESPTESPTDTTSPTAEPTPTATESPSASPSAEPTPAPTAEPTPAPTAEPTPAPTAEPTPAPTPEPTPAPTASPSPVPSDGGG